MEGFLGASKGGVGVVGVRNGQQSVARRLTSVSGPSTYPANRDFEGHVGGCGATAPQRFFLFFFIFFRKNS